MNNRKAEPMFYCGAQVNADDDLIASTFTVFPNTVEFKDAAFAVAQKIGNDMIELGISEGEGILELIAVETWQDFADIKLDDQIKMNALAFSVMHSMLDLVVHSSKMPGAIAELWSPLKS